MPEEGTSTLRAASFQLSSKAVFEITLPAFDNWEIDHSLTDLEEGEKSFTISELPSTLGLSLLYSPFFRGR